MIRLSGAMATLSYPLVGLYGGTEMKMQIRFSVPVALACILLAQGAQPRSSRIGPSERPLARRRAPLTTMAPAVRPLRR
jgi:hypothetical protein